MNAQQQMSLAEQLQPQMQADQGLDVMEYLRVLLKFKWGIIGLAVLLGLSGYYVALKAQPIYRSTAKLQIERQSGQVNLGNLLLQPTMGYEFYSTQYEMIKSWGVAEMSAIRMGLLDENGQVTDSGKPRATGGQGFSLKSLAARLLKTPVPVPTDAQRRDDIIAGIQNRTQVSPIKNSELVNISFEDPDPAFAAQLANTVAESYIDFLKTKHLEDITGNQTWYTSRLEQARQDMETAERALQDYNERFSLLLSSAGEGSEQSQRYRAADQARAQAQQQQSRLQDVYRQVMGARSKGGSLQDIAGLQGLAGVPPLRDAYLEAERRVAELSQRYGPKHPRMIDAQGVLDNSRKFYFDALESAADGVVAEYRAAESELALQTERFRQAEADVLALSRSQADKVKLENDVTQTRALYDQLRSGIRSADMMGAGIQKVNAMIIERARAGLYPVRPDKPRMIMMWALSGFALGVGLAFFLNYLDNTFRHSSEIERRLALPVLGMLPSLQLPKKPGGALGHFPKGTQPAYSEAIRTIRTGVMLSCLEQPNTCLVVTSSLPGEGKTSLSANLAYSMADMRKTLLVDLDLRRPSLQKTLGIDASKPGITEWLTGEAEMKDVLVAMEGTGLHVIPAGGFSTNAPDILSSRRLRTLLAELKKQYEYIVIDSPPVLAVSDAVIVSQLADAVLYVVQAETTPRRATEQGVKYLRRTDAPLLGVVMNRVSTQDLRYGYGKGGKYYRYGYHTDRVPHYYGGDHKA